MIDVSTPRHQRFSSDLQRDLFDGVYSGDQARAFTSALVDAAVQAYRRQTLGTGLLKGAPDLDSVSSLADLGLVGEEMMDKVEAAQADGRQVQLRCMISLEIDSRDDTPARRAG